MNQLQHYDVVILGGGLAGLTLALQLKQSKPDISVAVIEKREGPAPVAIHKVGESTTEIGSHYYREVLGLANYLEEKQLPNLDCDTSSALKMRTTSPSVLNVVQEHSIHIQPTNWTAESLKMTSSNSRRKLAPTFS
jgi:2-polyprenyl-6-methoxyphenol hydroxylase-like FAD-dependent oxidoreductase